MNTLTKLLCAASIVMATNAGATTLLFDDIPQNAPFTTVPHSYGNLDWNNFATINGALNPYSGYNVGVISPNYAIFNVFGDPASFSSATPFIFNSAYMTAAWREGLIVDVTGYLGNVALYTKSVVLNSTGSSLETFNWSGIDKVGFAAHDGIASNYAGSGTHFAIDNLTINVAQVPEPGSLALLGLALGGLAYSRRRRTAK